VNVTAAVKKVPFSLGRLLARLSPEQRSGQVLLWSALPSFLLLSNLGVSLLRPCVFTAFLPFLALLSTVSTFRYKTLGLAGSYLACGLFLAFFYSQVAPEDRLWQMGVFFSLALSLFVFLISAEEAAACLFDLRNAAESLKKRLSHAEDECALAKKSAEEKEKEFREEIEKLKEEAQQRRIEKVNEAEHLALINSEIEMLTAQKNTFIEAAERAREEAARHRLQLKEQEEKILKEKQCLAEEVAFQKRLLEEKEKCFFEGEQKAKEELSFHKELLEEQEKQYLLEIRKAQESIAAQKSLLEEQTSVFEVEKQKVEEVVAYHKQLLQAQEGKFEEKERLQKEELIVLQEKLIGFQQLMGQAEVEDPGLRKSHALLEVSLKQLRIQFEEKSHTLAQTRKELFQSETKVLALEKEKELAQLEYDQAHQLVKEMACLSDEIEKLEQEITRLEAIISNFVR
jgi:hypothetical protein